MAESSGKSSSASHGDASSARRRSSSPASAPAPRREHRSHACSRDHESAAANALIGATPYECSNTQ
eukprot:6202572-Pleurochrysis_carterae.AAC.1